MRIQGNFDGPLIRAILAPFDLKSFYVDERKSQRILELYLYRNTLLY